jgi:hypothetical protein
MDDDLRHRLFDPSGSRALIVARRPPGCSAMTAVVSDAVWREVVQLLRWTAASTGDSPQLDAGRWWRLASGCADLLRRLPALCDELGEGWDRPAVPGEEETGGPARVERTAGRLLGLLRTGEPVPLRIVAGEVDALGAAAITTLVESSSWVIPGTTRPGW